jgi:hypothetical protein
MGLGGGVGGAGLSLLALFWAASMRSTIQQLTGALRDRDARLAALERRPEAQPVDGLRRSVASVEADVRRVREEVALLREGVERASGRPSGVEELTTLVGRLGEDVSRAVSLAEKASQEARAAAGARPQPAAPSGASLDEMARVWGSVAAMETRLAELEQRKPAAAGPAPKVDEQALRELIRQVSAEEFQKLLEDWRSRMRGRQPGGRGGGGGN